MDYEGRLRKMRSEVLLAYSEQRRDLLEPAEVAVLDTLDSGDAAVREDTMHLHGELSGLDLQRLRQIDEALARLRDGQYGICVSCGQRIEVGRLDAAPEVTMCIVCAEDEEPVSVLPTSDY
jgi:DnaK suppressor protein